MRYWTSQDPATIAEEDIYDMREETRSQVRMMLDFYDNPESWASDVSDICVYGSEDIPKRIRECIDALEEVYADAQHGDFSRNLARSIKEQIGQIVWESVQAHCEGY